MNPRSFIPCLALVAVALGAQLASAQTPANLTVSTGNGQLICNECAETGPYFYQPITALVTDVNGNPIAGTTVTWTVSSGIGTIAGGQTSLTTNTDETGTAIVTPDSIFGLYQGGTYYQVTTITAQAGNLAAVTYTETNILASQGVSTVAVYFTNNGGTVPSGTTLSGTAGSTGSPIKVVVQGYSGVQGVEVRLVNADGTSGPSPAIPSLYCQTGSGADPWSVLTDSTGTATCTPVFGPVAGINSPVAVEVGGVPAGIWGVTGQDPTMPYDPSGVLYNPGLPGVLPLPAFQASGNININVTPAAIKSITPTSGNSQSAGTGQALANPLVATINGTSGPLIGQQVTWTASPAGAVQFSNLVTTSNSSGQVSATVTFTASAAGTVTIKATSIPNSSMSATFTETAIPPVTVSSLTKALGDGQSAIVGTAFANPLEVQVVTSSGSAANQTVAFSATGPITISATTASTNASGIAQVTATAGSTTGNASVTASIGGMSVTFSLTVVPQGPSITAASFVNGADQQRGSIAACGLATVAAANIAPAIAGTLTAPLVGPLPLQLGNVTVTFNAGDQAPIVSASANAVTFLAPCDLAAGSVPVTVAAGPSTTTVTVTLLPAGPGIFQTVQSDGVARAVVERPDGSFATASNPARRGETVTAFFTGLGAVSPSVATNALPIPGTPSTANSQVIVGVNNAGTIVLSSQLSATQPGVYAVTFQIPQNAPQSNSVTFSVGVLPTGASKVYYSAGSAIPIQ